MEVNFIARDRVAVLVIGGLIGLLVAGVVVATPVIAVATGDATARLANTAARGLDTLQAAFARETDDQLLVSGRE